MHLSVIICTHNPREDYLRRTLDGLRTQSLAMDRWELLLIDNASTTPLAGRWDLSWHPFSRVVREDCIGLTAARLRGMRESKGSLLVFVDDDNVLEPSYLERALFEYESNVRLGCLGAGMIAPEFTAEPSEEVAPFINMLALRQVARAVFCSEMRLNEALPYGAGLCVRRVVAEAYASSCRDSTGRLGLDRSGRQLMSGGDIDLALHACKLGMIAGVVPELQVLHLIPGERLHPDYLVRIAHGHELSRELLARIWGYASPRKKAVLSLLRSLKLALRRRGLSRRIAMAECRAKWEAILRR